MRLLDLPCPCPSLQQIISDGRDVDKREALVPFVSIIRYSCVVEPRDEHHYAQHCKENPCIQKNRDIQQERLEI